MGERGVARRWRRAALGVVMVLVAAMVVPGSAGASFPGANGRIAFASIAIYSVNPDGTGLVQLTEANAPHYHPAWSPDGTKLAYVGWAGHEEIFTVNADGSGRRQLTNQQFGDFGPAWSPDGTKIAFYTFRHDDKSGLPRNTEIYVMDADGANPVRLTNDPAPDSYPAWSPDGTKIAYRSTQDGNGDIYVMNADGTGTVRLTTDPAAENSPSWSPDGTKIAFFSNRDGDGAGDVFVMNADGTGQTNLTNSPGHDGIPAWSPDGTKIAFTTERDGNSEIYVMQADGTAPTNVSQRPSSRDFDPTWQPLPGTPPTTSTTTSTTTTVATTTSTTTPPATRTQLSPPLGTRKAIFTASSSGVDPGKLYALFFADRNRLTNGPCHQAGTKVGGPVAAASDGTIAAVGQVPVNAARGSGEVCFALKNNRANHSDTAPFLVY